jgi:hypothetical protein
MDKVIASLMGLAEIFRGRIPSLIKSANSQSLASRIRRSKSNRSEIRALGRKFLTAKMVRHPDANSKGPSRNRLRRIRQRNAADRLRYDFDPAFRAYVDSVVELITD